MAQQQGQQGTDSGMGPIWVIVGLFVAAFFVWRMAHHYIVTVIFEINILSLRRHDT